MCGKTEYGCVSVCTQPTVSAGTTTGLAYGTAPYVTNTGSSANAIFNFGIPAGATGATGPSGIIQTLYQTLYPSTIIAVTGTAYVTVFTQSITTTTGKFRVEAKATILSGSLTFAKLTYNGNIIDQSKFNGANNACQIMCQGYVNIAPGTYTILFQVRNNASASNSIDPTQEGSNANLLIQEFSQ